MQDAKKKISDYVEAYKSTFADEYSKFLTYNRQDINLRIEGVKKNSSGFTADVSDKIGRQLTEVPETLYSILLTRLEPEEFKWFNSTEGKVWFADNFKEFSAYKKS